ncbi:hypothetical protein N5D53_02060 [Pseudomonas sp. GD03862]|uniref:hypothetical protein n=1 Tax=Pseudomonas sp. GD03862 TaxID=2975391 RepID=UPI002449CF34|nr:hypothetical protein [Pseudomonas sp. GD03862]MDH0705312.1 hypothetical protein [Pseudomonas sp. GD03862]
MPEDENQRFAEALEHWAEVVDEIRARERAQEIAQAEELEKLHIWRAFHASAMGKHHAGKRRK